MTAQTPRPDGQPPERSNPDIPGIDAVEHAEPSIEEKLGKEGGKPDRPNHEHPEDQNSG